MKTKIPIFDFLKKNFDDFSKSQKILAKQILTNYQKVAFLTIKELSEVSGVSEATIVRFVKFLGFHGFPDFIKEIRRIVRSDLKGDERFRITGPKSKQKKDLISEIIDKEIENILHLQKISNPGAISNAIDAISKSSEVVVVGIRATASLACHFSFGLSKLSKKTTRILSINTETYDLINRIDKDALVIIIGFPRYVNELFQFIKFCKKNSIKTLSITDSPFSPLVSDINVYSPAESTSFIAFHCAPLLLINTIIIALSMKNKNTTVKSLNRFEKLAEANKYFIKI